jgi:hypothetical protein
MFRVGLSQRMDASFGADPDLQLLGPFANFDAGTELLESRNMVPIPHRYMRFFLASPLTPRQAWETVAHAIITNNDQAACAPLLDFIRLACTSNAAGDNASPLARQALIVPQLDAPLMRHRTELIEHKLPGLNRTPIMAAGQQVAQSLGELVQEQRAARQDQRDRQDLNSAKTIEDYFGASTHTLLRLCQVATTAQLPPVYQSMADYGKKKERITMQRAIDDMMSQMGLGDLQFVVTAELAMKLSTLMWKAHPEDLSQGLHPFSVGETSPDAIIALQDLARKYDLISSDGASPSLNDAQELIGVGKASIARNLISLDAQNHLFLVLLNVFLGTTHSNTIAWEQHAIETKRRLITLQFYTPRTPRHQLLLPALIQRWAQLRWSYWVDLQWNSMNDVPAPSWSDLWMHITLRTDWESPLPERYLAALPLLAFQPGKPPTGRIESANPGLVKEPLPGPPPPDKDKITASAEKCSPYLEVYSPYRSTGKRVRDVIKEASAAGNKLPQNDAGKDMCISFHVKGICNTGCGRKSDHQPHSDGETARLAGWCQSAFT